MGSRSPAFECTIYSFTLDRSAERRKSVSKETLRNNFGIYRVLKGVITSEVGQLGLEVLVTIAIN